MACVGMYAKTLFRGSKTRKLTTFVATSGVWIEELNEDGQTIKVYQFDGVLGLKLQSDVAVDVSDNRGLVVAVNKQMRTIYNVIIGNLATDHFLALMKQHTLQDAKLSIGEVCKKPMTMDMPGRWGSPAYAVMKTLAKAFGLFLGITFDKGPKEKLCLWPTTCSEKPFVDISFSCCSMTSVSAYDLLGPNVSSFIVADSVWEALMSNCCIRPSFYLGEPQVIGNKTNALVSVLEKQKLDDAFALKMRNVGRSFRYCALFHAFLFFQSTRTAMAGRVRFYVTGGIPPYRHEEDQGRVAFGRPEELPCFIIGMKKKKTKDVFLLDGQSSWKKNAFKTYFGEYALVEKVETHEDACPSVDFVFPPKETKTVDDPLPLFGPASPMVKAPVASLGGDPVAPDEAVTRFSNGHGLIGSRKFASQ